MACLSNQHHRTLCPMEVSMAGRKSQIEGTASVLHRVDRVGGYSVVCPTQGDEAIWSFSRHTSMVSYGPVRERV